MTDRVHPSIKPNGPPTNTVTVTTINNPKLPLPPARAHLHNQNSHPYRRTPTHYHHTRRRCFCLSCFWLLLIIILMLLLATISGTVLYLLYRPHRPEFSVTSLKTFRFNLNLTISTKNPNKKIEFHYDPIAITCVTDGTEIASGYFRNSFASKPNNITTIRSSSTINSLLLETESVKKKKLGLPLKILLDTQVIVKAESFKSKKVGIRIKCEGIRSVMPKSGGARSNSSSSSVSATVSEAKCEVDFRIKIWKWTF